MGPCWLWTKTIQSEGYGVLRVDGKLEYVHRLTYELLKTSIPEGLELDHICRIRRCCNPDHLEPVTHLVNVNRGSNFQSSKTHCINGHELSIDNLYFRSDNPNARVCKTCAIQRAKGK